MISPATAIKLAPWVLVVLMGLWAGWERNGRKDAEIANVKQQKQILEDANKVWGQVNDARLKYDEEVASGLARINEKQRQMEATIDDYQKAVRADPGGQRPLSPGELAALKLLVRPNSNQAGGGAVRSSNTPTPVR